MAKVELTEFALDRILQGSLGKFLRPMPNKTNEAVLVGELTIKVKRILYESVELDIVISDGNGNELGFIRGPELYAGDTLGLQPSAAVVVAAKVKVSNS